MFSTFFLCAVSRHPVTSSLAALRASATSPLPSLVLVPGPWPLAPGPWALTLWPIGRRKAERTLRRETGKANIQFSPLGNTTKVSQLRFVCHRRVATLHGFSLLRKNRLLLLLLCSALLCSGCVGTVSTSSLSPSLFLCGRGSGAEAPPASAASSSTPPTPSEERRSRHHWLGHFRQLIGRMSLEDPFFVVKE